MNPGPRPALGPAPGKRPAAEAILGAALEEGRRSLLEPEGLALLAGLGFEPPRHILVDDAAAVTAESLAALPGRHVVVKLVSAQVAHRSEIGGVARVEREVEAVRATIRDMAARSPDPAARYLLAEYVPHRQDPGAELLLAVRWTDEFGSVASLGPGGVTAEAVAGLLRADERMLAFPLGATRAEIAESLAGPGLAALLTGRVRGRAPEPDPGHLARVIEALLDFASRTMPDRVREIEINPLVFRAAAAVPLDVLVRLGPGTGRRFETRPAPIAPARRASIRALLEPRSIAVAGVSSRMNPGRVILRNILEAGFPAAAVRVVKPDAAEIDGVACVSGIAALEPPVDLLVVSVSAAQAPGMITAAVAGGRARAIIVIPGGLGEREGSNDRALALETSLAAHAGPARAVVNGGNCLGIRSVPGRYDTLFIPKQKLAFPSVPPHPVALISQSGAFAIARTSALPWLNPRYLVTLGNQIDLTVGEYLEHLADDPDVRVFACYVEGFRPGDGRRFLNATRRITAQGRAVILYRAGRSAAGADAMASHTASIAGEYALTRELARSAGALVADTIDEFDDLLSLATRLDQARVDGLRLGALSNAGFECVAMADRIGPFSMPPFTEPTRAALTGLLEANGLAEIVAARNPLDVTPILADPAFTDAVRLVLADPAVDVGVVGCVPLTPALHTLPAADAGPDGFGGPDRVVPGVAAIRSSTDKAWIAVVDSGPAYDAMARAWSDAGIPVFRSADRAVRMFGRWCEWRQRTEGRRNASGPMPAGGPP